MRKKPQTLDNRDQKHQIENRNEKRRDIEKTRNKKKCFFHSIIRETIFEFNVYSIEWINE